MIENSPSLAPFCLSTQGCGRATAYSEQPKIISANGKIHVAWLDAGDEGFRVRARTMDQATGEWSPTVTVGEAQDNHGGPGLTIDSKGYLNIIYYPHHEQFRHRRSIRPHDMSEWEPEIRFGQDLSFPSVVCTPDDKLILTARRGYHFDNIDYVISAPFEQELWEKPADGDWRYVSTLIRSRVTGYGQFASALQWGPDHHTLHLNCRIYEGLPGKDKGPSVTIGYLVSPDAGSTWTKSDSTPVTLPVTAEDIDVIAQTKTDNNNTLSSGPLAVDKSGTPYMVYSLDNGDTSPLILASPNGHGGWNQRDLTSYLPPDWRSYRSSLAMGGGITLTDSGRGVIVAILVKLPDIEGVDLAKEWGHASTEMVRLWSDDDMKTFSSEIIPSPDPTRAHWLVNIERATGHNQVPENPGIIFTKGGAGADLHALGLGNEVWWNA